MFFALRLSANVNQSFTFLLLNYKPTRVIPIVYKNSVSLCFLRCKSWFLFQSYITFHPLTRVKEKRTSFSNHSSISIFFSLFTYKKKIHDFKPISTETKTDSDAVSLSAWLTSLSTFSVFLRQMFFLFQSTSNPFKYECVRNMTCDW